MKSKLMVAVALAALTLTVSGSAWAKPDANQMAAVADAGRPKADTDRDEARKPGEMLAFAGVKQGQVVADFIPGGGYFTRLFSKAVGPKGKVYSLLSKPPANAPPPANPPAVKAIAADANYKNVTVVEADYATMQLPEKVDLVWTSQNYHDLYRRGPEAAKAVTKAIYDNLKPGGVFIVLDHAASAGAPVDPQDKLHRIDPAIVKADVTAVGFKYEGESKVLVNPADDHTKPVFDPSLRGHTDQFIYKFRKPK